MRQARPIATPPAAPDHTPIDLPGAVRSPTIAGLPEGYVYGVTRYADVILNSSFPGRMSDLVTALESFRPTLDELRTGGGGRTVFVARFDKSLYDTLEDGDRMWGKQNITIEKSIGFDDHVAPVAKVRGHEIDMFGKGSRKEPFPGVAVEMEWNNKDPFFDRDLINFEALHREGAIAVGVIVTRGPALQELISGVIRSKDSGFKYGPSSTHWDKLLPRVNLGGGGECPLLLIGIQPERIAGIELAQTVKAKLDKAVDIHRNWPSHYKTYREARVAISALREEALRTMPALDDAEQQ